MSHLRWRIEPALPTFFVCTVLALIWVSIDNKPIKTVIGQSRPSEIEIVVPEDKIRKPPSDNKPPVKPSYSKNSSSIQYIKSGGEFCEKYLLKKIAKEKSADSQVIKLKKFNTNEVTLSPNFKKWLEYMRKEELLAAELRNNQQKALLLISKSYAATGLATNLENWHIEIDGIYSGEFWSFSKNPNLVF